MLGFYVADRLCALIFKVRLGRSIHGASPLDERVRTFISRRNVNLLIITAAVFFDWIVPGYGAALLAFQFIVVWQVVCFFWHAERVVHFWNAHTSG